MNSKVSIDPIEFRNALGVFATGVTVISTQCEEVGRIGITANSFNSVSLDPPMVLWSLGKGSRALQFFQDAGHFCVNVLAADQVSLSNHFASKIEDKFAEVDYQDGALGSPVLAGCAATFECKTAFVYEGGDHLIFVGEVVNFQNHGKAGLLYHSGKYSVSNPHPANGLYKPQESVTPNGFVDDYLNYLLAKAADNFEGGFQKHLDKRGISKFEWRILVTLNDYGALSLERLESIVLLGGGALWDQLGQMLEKGWLQNEEGTAEYGLTESGEAEVAHLLAAAKSHEIDSLGQFTLDESLLLKSLLKRLV